MKKFSCTRFEAGLDDSFLQNLDSGDSAMRKLFTYKVDSMTEEQKKKLEEGEVEKNLFSLPIIYKTQDTENNESEQVTSES